MTSPAPLPFPSRPLTPEENMQVIRNLFGALNGFGQRVTELDAKLSTIEGKLDNEIALRSSQQLALQRAIGRRVRQMLPDDKAYHANSKIYFAALYRALKDVYQVPSYRDIPRIMFDHALQYVDGWEYVGAA